MKLFPYQEDGVRHLTSSLPASYLADKPGLGKTLQAITAATQLGAQSLLILCPAAIVSQWQAHVKSWGNRARVVSYDSIAMSRFSKKNKVAFTAATEEVERLRAAAQPQDAEWKDALIAATKRVTTLSAVRLRKAKAAALREDVRENGPYDVIICDEAHQLKERTSNRTGFVFHPTYGLRALGKKIMLLSGTPMLNRPAELYPVLRACYPQALFDCPNFEAYAYKFCDPQWGFNGSTNYNGSSNEAELGKRLQGFMLMRGAEVLGARLPTVQYRDQRISLADNRDEIDVAEHVATRRRMTGEAKVDVLVADIRKVSQTVDKLVIFYFHDSVRRALQRAFIHAPLIKGGLTSHQKAQQIDRFVKLSCRVILVQLGAGGVGLDGLQYVCNTGYLAELDWTPALEEQAVGRLHRLGQSSPVTIYRPIGTEAGLDEHIDKTGERKLAVITSILSHVLSVEGIASMETDQIVLALIRIANAVERLAAVQDGQEAEPVVTPKKPRAPKPVVEDEEEAPAPKKGKKAKPVAEDEEEEEIAPPKKGKKAKPADEVISLKEAGDLLMSVVNSDPSLTQKRQVAYKELLSDYGVAKLADVDEQERQGFVDSAISVLNKIGKKKASVDDDSFEV